MPSDSARYVSGKDRDLSSLKMGIRLKMNIWLPSPGMKKHQDSVITSMVAPIPLSVIASHMGLRVS
jgi:hypothetical protein